MIGAQLDRLGKRMKSEIKPEIKKWGDYLHEARKASGEVDYIKKQVESLSVEEAYQIQDSGIQSRVDDGENVIALKMGLTSEAKRKQMNLFSAIYGVLTDKMQVTDQYALEGSIHPKIEPEIAFYVSKDLNKDSSEDEIRAACTKIAPALEILDSRFKSFKYFSLEDVIADNASSSHFSLGKEQAWDGKSDLKNLNMKMLVNGEVVQEGTSGAISGDPIKSIFDQVKLLGERGKSLKANTWVLAGAATPAYPLTGACEVSLEIENMTSMKLSILGK